MQYIIAALIVLIKKKKQKEITAQEEKAIEEIEKKDNTKGKKDEDVRTREVYLGCEVLIQF